MWTLYGLSSDFQPRILSPKLLQPSPEDISLIMTTGMSKVDMWISCGTSRSHYMLISGLASGTGGEVVGIIKAAKPRRDVYSRFYWHQKNGYFSQEVRPSPCVFFCGTSGRFVVDIQFDEGQTDNEFLNNQGSHCCLAVLPFEPFHWTISLMAAVKVCFSSELVLIFLYNYFHMLWLKLFWHVLWTDHRHRHCWSCRFKDNCIVSRYPERTNEQLRTNMSLFFHSVYNGDTIACRDGASLNRSLSLHFPGRLNSIMNTKFIGNHSKCRWCHYSVTFCAISI